MSRGLVDENSSLTVVEPPSAESKKSSCCQVIRDEFRLKNFCFDFDNENVFYSSQWRLPRLIFAISRVCLAVYVGTICLMTISYFPHESKWPWPVYLTNWSYVLFACHEVVAATIAVVHVKDSTAGSCCMELHDNENKCNKAEGDVIDYSFTVGRRKSVGRKPGDSLPCYIKLSWLLFSVACPMAVIVAILANTAGMATVSAGHRMSFEDFNTHVLNGIIVVLEICIAAFPVRLFHVVYVGLYVSIYFLFSYIFWSFDHTWNIIYTIMDWEDSGPTMFGWVLFVMICAPIVQIIFFAAYRLKILICSKIFDHERDDYVDV